MSDIQVPFNYPYRRYSSDVYATALVELLEQNNFGFSLMNEPEGASSVFLGSSVVPGVIVMVRAEDARAIQVLESRINPSVNSIPAGNEQEERLDNAWLAIAYCFAVLGAPIAIIAGIHFFTARRRNRNLSSRYAYDARTRMHGKLIFFFALAILLFSMGRLIMGGRMSFLDTLSFAIWQIDNAL